jgi:hypothetical protein
MLRQALHHLSHIPSPFALVIFSIGSYFYAQAGLDYGPIYTFHIAGMGKHHHAQLLLADTGSHEHFFLSWS